MAAASDELVARGVVPEMPLAEAQALAGERRAAQLVEQDPLAERRALARVARACHAISPQVATADDCADAVWLDVTGLAHLYGGEDRLLAEATAHLTAAGWTCRAALADSFAAAWALARYRAEAGRPLVVPPGATPRFVADLPVEALRLSAQITGNLWKLGLRRVGQVAALPRRSLAACLEAEVARRLDGLHAAVPEALQGVPAAEPWEAAVSWEVPLENADVLARELGRLFAALAGRLSRHNLGATLVRVRLLCPPAEPIGLELHLFTPSVQDRHWLELALLQLERRPLSAGVSAIEISAVHVAPRTRRQLTFLATGPGSADDAQTSALLARLTSRLGERAVIRPELVPDAQPERAWRPRPVTAPRPRTAARPGGKSRAAQRRCAPTAPRSWPERPSSLWPLARRPLAVELGADGRPRAFAWQGGREQVAQARGPERIETGWWRGRRVRRDYYCVETAAGARAWLFEHLEDHTWHLHGWFD